MSELLYFDVHAAYGAFPNKEHEARWSLEHLLDDLELAGIAGAVTLHHQALHDEAMVGNRRLVREIAPHRDRLFPCWVALPEVGGDFPSAGELAREMRDHDVRVVRIDPELIGVPPIERLWAPLRDALAEIDALCIVPIPYGRQDVSNIERTLAIFRDLNTVIVGHTWSQWRQVASLMTLFPKLHLEFSHFQANRAVEWFAGKFGAHRCLFGTGLPHRAPGAARGFFDYSLLPRPDVAQIAAGNLTRLLGGRGPRSIPSPSRWYDAITTAVRIGQPIPCEVWDAHCHIGHDGCTALSNAVIAHHGDADGMIELTRRIGINKTAIMSWAGPLGLNSRAGNEIVASAVRRYPDEFIGLVTINPEYDSPDEIERIIRQYHDELRFPGLKTFAPYQNIDYDDPLLARWLQYANDHKLYMVFDPKGGTSATPVARNLATRYPNLSIHLDHCGQSWPYAKWAVSVMREHPNIFAQLNFTLVTNGVIEYLVEQVGADRVLFGTDAPMRDPRPQATWLAFTRLAEADKRKIYGENFAKDLARCFTRD